MTIEIQRAHNSFLVYHVEVEYYGDKERKYYLLKCVYRLKKVGSSWHLWFCDVDQRLNFNKYDDFAGKYVSTTKLKEFNRRSDALKELRILAFAHSI